MALREKLRWLTKMPGGRQAVAGVRALLAHNAVDVDSLSQQSQKILLNQYREAFRRGEPPYTHIAEAGFRCYSQFEEDGMILYVLAGIGMTTKKVVEICCGIGRECMAANLIINHGFSGYLFDGDAGNIRKATAFFRAKPDCLLNPPVLHQAWITRDNINALLTEVGAAGEVDVLSLDIDGNDYYIWEAITAINPRLCIFETHNVIPTELSLTIPYVENFNCWREQGARQDFRSVSLAAMQKLSARKGYRMIGAHRHGFNVLFLRNDIAPALFPEIDARTVHDNHWTRVAQAERWPAVKDMGWVEV